jgi:uncharacterized protein YicC (UPF0701 family)
VAEGDIRPIPDPTDLTTEQLKTSIKSAFDNLTTRLDGMDALTLERFAGIKQELVVIERQRLEQKTDTAISVVAALTSAKELVAQQTQASERAINTANTATAEQLKQLSVTRNSENTALRTSLSDLKERVDRIEASGAGAAAAMGRLYAAAGFILVLLSIAAIAFGLQK